MSTPGQALASAPRPSKFARLRPPHSWKEQRNTNIQAIQDDIHNALRSAFNPHPAQYGRAICVLIHFDNDDIGVQPLAEEPERVLKQRFKYVTMRLILKGQATLELRQMIMWLETQKYTDEGNLIVLVFSGHGEVATDTLGRTYLRIGQVLSFRGTLQCTNETSSGALNSTGDALVEPTVNWTHSVSGLDFAQADVLHILDCCYADQAATGSAEVLAATSAVEKAGSDLDTSFTKALITELQRSSTGIMSAARLHGELMRSKDDTSLLATPYYAERTGRASCTLRRMQAHGQYHGKSVVPGSQGKRKAKTDETRIIVGVTVKETLGRRDVDGIKKWLLIQVPGVVTGLDIELSGLWDTHSNYLQFTVPIEIWTQLPTDSAWVYVATVTSGNKLLLPTAPSTSELAIRPIQGSENVCPRGASPSKGFGGP
jgi:hypothetical protein